MKNTSLSIINKRDKNFQEGEIRSKMPDLANKLVSDANGSSSWSTIQFWAAKIARKPGSSSERVLTIHIHWYENVKMNQARKEKSACYIYREISIHVMYAWVTSGNKSVVCSSDWTTHGTQCLQAYRLFCVCTSVSPLVITWSWISELKNQTVWSLIEISEPWIYIAKEFYCLFLLCRD